MPFGLKNTGATYQQLVNRVFKTFIMKTMEVCVNGMIVKSTLGEGHATVLQETFLNVRNYDMTLNPKKYIYRVRSGKFLGFMISSCGIEANLDKMQAVLNTKAP